MNTHPGTYLALGFDLEPFVPVEQAEICHHLADQVDSFTKSLSNGWLSSVEISDGFLQLTVHCQNTGQALKDFISMVENEEIDIPEDSDEDSVIRYAMIGEGGPSQLMHEMIDQLYGEQQCCDDCTKAMRAEEAAHAEIEGKQLAETSEPAGGSQ